MCQSCKDLEERFAALEKRVSELQAHFNAQLDLYRRLQVGDEAQIQLIMQDVKQLFGAVAQRECSGQNLDPTCAANPSRHSASPSRHALYP